MGDVDAFERLNAALRGVAGEGGHGVRRGYLWMLSGDDDRIKPDQIVLRWFRSQGVTAAGCGDCALRGGQNQRHACGPTDYGMGGRPPSVGGGSRTVGQLMLEDGRVDVPSEPPQKASVLARTCAALSVGDEARAKSILTADYPLVSGAKAPRRYSIQQMLRTFYRDGFVDRYSGERLVHPGALRTLSVVLPNEFPAHPNWKMSETHFAFWEMFPTIDHVVPVARGGVDDDSNWVTTSMLRNSAKAHWTLDELGWSTHPPGDPADWDGLSGWFVDYVTEHDDVAASSEYIRRWLRATSAIKDEGIG